MKRLRFCLLPVLLLLSILPAQAHGYIVRAIPADRAVLEHSPARLQYWFSEPLEPRFSEVLLRDAGGSILARGSVDETNTALMMLQIPPGLLKDGAYIVELRAAFASDGHAAAESSVFYIGKEISGIEGQARDDSASALEVLWKALLLSSTFLLFGAFSLYGLVFVPAWGSAVYPAGLLPPRVMQRLNRIVWTGIMLAVVANVLALLQQTMVFFNVDAGTAISGGLWQVVRSGSRAGDVWTLRMMLFIVLIGTHIASIRYRERVPDMVQSSWTANAWLMALMIGAQSVNSHAAGALVLPWTAMLMHWLHSLGAAFWVGGLIVLVMVLPAALQPCSGEEQRTALIPVMQRFSRLMTGMIALIITTGIYNATTWFFTPSDLGTHYATSLAYKLFLIALLLPVAALHHVVLRPALTVKLERLSARILPHRLMMLTARLYYAMIRAAGYFSGTLRLEMVLATVALVLASILSATPVPIPEFARQNIPLLTASQQVDGLDVTLTLTPGAPGINTFDVVIQRGGSSVTGAIAALQVANPAKDWRSPWLPADLVEDGLYVAASDAIDATGTWWTLLDINTGGRISRVFFAWQVTNDALILQSRPPSVLTLLALAAVVISAVYVLMPLLRQLAGMFSLHPSSLLGGGGVTLISIILLGFAIWAVQEQQRQIQAALLPPPTLINSVLPHAASLARGAAIYHAACSTWQASPDFQALIRSLDILRDEDLYRIPAEGWRSIPPCERELTNQDTWDVVNFFRTQRHQEK